MSYWLRTAIAAMVMPRFIIIKKAKHFMQTKIVNFEDYSRALLLYGKFRMIFTKHEGQELDFSACYSMHY